MRSMLSVAAIAAAALICCLPTTHAHGLSASTGSTRLASMQAAGQHGEAATAQDQQTNNFADLPLRSDLKALSVIVSPGGPVGGCTSGYSWNPRFGGCRSIRLETDRQTDACPAGYRGTRTRTRTRTAYALQANAVDVQYDDWTAWSAWDQSGCSVDVPPRKPGISDVVAVRGTTFGANGHAYAVVAIDNATSKLVCRGRGTSYNEHNGDTPDVIYTGPFQTDVASCEVQASGLQATAYGNCDTTSGGDGDYCLPATAAVTIKSTAGCTVSTETRTGGRLLASKDYNVCQ